MADFRHFRHNGHPVLIDDCDVSDAMTKHVKPILPWLEARMDEVIADWAAQVGMTPEQWGRYWLAVIHVHCDEHGKPFRYSMKAMVRERAEN